MPNNKPHAVPESEKDRADGWYWVKWFKSAPWVTTEWTTNVDRGGEWLEDYPEHDSSPFEIGPRILLPDEQPVPTERPVELADAEGLLALCDKATPGPWQSTLAGEPGVYIGLRVSSPGCIKYKARVLRAGEDEDELEDLRESMDEKEDLDLTVSDQALLKLEDNLIFAAAARTALPAAIRYALALEAQGRELQADKERLDWLEQQRPCTLQMWVQQTAIHKPGSMFEMNEYHKSIREAIDAAKGGKL